MSRFSPLLAALLLLPALALAQVPDGRLKKILSTKSISIAYRSDALPFSFVDGNKQPVGYTIDLCKRVVGSIEQQFNVQPIAIRWVPVTTQNRMDAVASGDADLECGSTTVTLSRMKQVDFSSFVFIDGTALLVRNDTGARSLGDLAGKRIGVIGGTSNEKALESALKNTLVSATVVKVKDRDEAVTRLTDKSIDAFASDRILVLGMATKFSDPKALTVLAENLSIEPYAIVLPRGDAALRLAVNTGLAQVFRSDAIVDVYGRWFGSLGKPSDLLQAMYLFGAIPE
jgi:ABC-type amino acid transport substrate-binding protein